MTRKEIIEGLFAVEAKILADKPLTELEHIRELIQVLAQLDTLEQTMLAEFPTKMSQAEREAIATAVEAKLPPTP